jgi:hypothetical protein
MQFECSGEPYRMFAAIDSILQILSSHFSTITFGSFAKNALCAESSLARECQLRPHSDNRKKEGTL